MKIACVVPARLESKRFPRKALYVIDGQPMVCRTMQRAIDAECFSEVFCFTDSVEIKKAVKHLPIKVCLTQATRNGTERIANNMLMIDADLIVDLQADEPYFPIDGLRLLAAKLHEQPEAVHVLVTKASADEMMNPNRVKAIVLRRYSEWKVLDFVRSVKSYLPMCGVHLGAYAYSKKFLKRYLETPPSRQEKEMSHEMLRIQPLPDIQAHWVEKGSASIDTPEDVDSIASRT